MTNSQPPTEFAGGCACGALRYECAAAPLAMANCHCRDCQRTTGAAFSPVVIVRREAFRIARGEPVTYESPTASGSTAHRAFCRDCGSQLFAWSDATQQFLGVKAGTLDDPSWFRPTIEVWTASAQPWAHLRPDTIKFERNPTRE